MKNHGFSLVELVVILAIIGVLLSITHLNFTEMHKKERTKADIAKVQTTIRTAQMACISQSRTGILVLGGNTFTANLYTTDSLETPPVISLAGTGMPNMPVTTPPPTPVPGEAPALIINSERLSVQTQGYTTLYVDRRGFVYFTDPDTNQPVYKAVAMCFSGQAIVINGILPDGKDCKPEEVVF